jgi:flagellar basal body L-ring protein FlgH
MNIKNLIFILFLLLTSCGTNRRFVSDEDTDSAIVDLKRDIASHKEIVTEKDPPNPSLWTGKGTDSYLFTNASERKLGDIIIIDVYGNLRKEIGTELKLDAKAQGLEEAGDKKEGAAPAEKPAEEVATERDDKPSDQNSTVVEEEVNQTHLLLKGKKTVVFKGTKKLLEINALVAKKDIQPNDRVNSKNLMETTVTVIR